MTEAGVPGPWKRSSNGGPVGSEREDRTGRLTGLRRGTEGRLRSTGSCGVMPEEARTAPIFK